MEENTWSTVIGPSDFSHTCALAKTAASFYCHSGHGNAGGCGDAGVTGAEWQRKWQHLLVRLNLILVD